VVEVLLEQRPATQTLTGCLAVLVVAVDGIAPLLVQAVPETRQVLLLHKEIMVVTR
jgi:hypothetical protein